MKNVYLAGGMLLLPAGKTVRRNEEIRPIACICRLKKELTALTIRVPSITPVHFG